MKKIILLLAVSLIHISCFTQANKDVFLLYNKDWSFAKNIESATYFMHEEVVNDTTYICRFYYKNGPLIQMETYRDTGLDIRHGRFAWYNIKGDIDSMGSYYEGKKDKWWEYEFDDSTHAGSAEEYDRGILIKKVNYRTRKIYWAGGKEEPFDETKPKNYQRAEFRNGGIKGWGAYLNHNLRMPDRFLQLAGERSGRTVRAGFEINEEGIISDIFIFHSCEWSADTEAIRVIKKSPPWDPAVEGGKKTKYRLIQNITFQMR